MNFEKTLTERIRRHLSLVIAAAGVFSLFTSCSMREVSSASDPSALSPIISVSVTDSSVQPSETIEYTKKPFPALIESSAEWSQLYESTHGTDSASALIMSTEEIREFNRSVAENCAAVVDMTDLPKSIGREELLGMIQKYSIPSGNYYDKSGRLITADEVEAIRANMNLGSIAEKTSPKTAVIVERCSLKSIPTELDFHKNGDTYYSVIQETELIASFPVQILHESADSRYLFVQSYYYFGWIPSEAAAVCSEESYMVFASPENYVTVIQPYTEISGTRYDMGAVLPYISEDDSFFKVMKPSRSKENGMLEFTIETVPMSDAVFGSLPYTYENFCSQAFRYLGTEYGWGGADGGIDCSGFICSVFRSFGIYLPRNTGDQQMNSGPVTAVSGYSSEKTLSVFDSLKYPASVHRPGHVMLFLGVKNGVPYVIHAPQGGEKVSVMALSYTGDLKYISEIFTFPAETPVND